MMLLQRKCRKKMIGIKLQNMEEMQNVIQNTSEISAKESVKQIAQLGRIEKNTHQTATVAEITAATSYGTYQNTKETSALTH